VAQAFSQLSLYEEDEEGPRVQYTSKVTQLHFQAPQVPFPHLGQATLPLFYSEGYPPEWMSRLVSLFPVELPVSFHKIEAHLPRTACDLSMLSAGTRKVPRPPRRSSWVRGCFFLLGERIWMPELFADDQSFPAKLPSLSFWPTGHQWTSQSSSFRCLPKDKKSFDC